MYDPTIAIILILGIFVFLLLMRVPISFCLAISTVVTALYCHIPLLSVFQRMVQGIWSFSLLAIPFFILTGEIMGQGGISQRLIDFSNVLVGRMRGGLAMVNVLSSMFFGGISGSAVADTSSIGSMMIPMMEKDGYDTDYSVGITVTSACQGVIIPPSHNMVMFSLAAGGVSVGKLFLGGFVPGVILGLALMVIAYIIAVKRNYPKGKKYTLKEALKISFNSLLGIMTAVIIVGGVLSGVFTATESAAIACVYAFIVTFFIYREIPLRQFNSILNNSLKTLSMVIALISTASAFGWMLSYLKIPAMVTSGLLSLSDNKVVLLLLINVMLLLLGCIMDMGPLILIMTPILLPVVTSPAIGMDPVHFGIMLILNLAIGLCTPPVGSCLFVGCSIGNISIEKVSRSMLPFYAAMIITLLCITFIPQIVMFVPNLLMP